MKQDKNSTLYVGAGKAAIVLPECFFPYAGFSGRYLTGKMDDLYARSLLIQVHNCQILLISIEIGDITDEWIPEIADKTGISPDCIFLAATHTHSAPYANSTWGENVKDAEKTEPFCKACLDAVFSSVQEAKDSLCAATAYVAEGSCDINVSRVRPYTGNQENVTARFISAANSHAFSDKTVAAIVFKDVKGHEIACILNYAVHSSILFRQYWKPQVEGSKMSGDVAGATMRYLESRLPDTVVLYTLGAAGDQMPRYTMVHKEFDKDGNFTTIDYGDDIGQGLVDAMSSELGDEVFYLIKENLSQVDVQNINTYKTIVTSMGKEEWKGGPPYSIPVNYQYVPTEMIDMPLQLITIGDLALVTVPGEIVASIGCDIKNVVKRQGYPFVIVVTQCNGAFQYICDDMGYDHMTMEANASHFMKGISDAILEGVTAMCIAAKR